MVISVTVTVNLNHTVLQELKGFHQLAQNALKCTHFNVNPLKCIGVR